MSAATQAPNEAKRQIKEAFQRAGLTVPSVKEVLANLPLDQQLDGGVLLEHLAVLGLAGEPRFFGGARSRGTA